MSVEALNQYVPSSWVDRSKRALSFVNALSAVDRKKFDSPARKVSDKSPAHCDARFDHQECLDIAETYLGKLTGAFTDWTPLQGRGELFPETLDVDNPWQLQNIRGRQWIA